MQESHRLQEVKSQSNSFSFLKFELESNSKVDNYHYLKGKDYLKDNDYFEGKDYLESEDYLKDKDRMAKAHYSP